MEEKKEEKERRRERRRKGWVLLRSQVGGARCLAATLWVLPSTMTLSQICHHWAIGIFQFCDNCMGPPLHMQSLSDQNIFMQCTTIHSLRGQLGLGMVLVNESRRLKTWLESLYGSSLPPSWSKWVVSEKILGLTSWSSEIVQVSEIQNHGSQLQEKG